VTDQFPILGVPCSAQRQDHRLVPQRVLAARHISVLLLDAGPGFTGLIQESSRVARRDPLLRGRAG
jgi:hypothetical protein